jgi:hypothetical protein
VIVEGAPRVAVSTSSCPRLRVSEIAEAVLSSGGNAVELRAGRGHGWEKDGAPAFVAAGVAVTAIAGSRILGAAAPANEPDVKQAESVGASLRCFLDAQCETDEGATRRARAQAGALQRVLGEEGRVMIEPHPGWASVPQVAAFCADTGAGAVLDTLAVQRLGFGLPRAFSELAGATRALHLKGFEPGGDRAWRHRPLELGDLPALSSLAQARSLATFVVETRAGSHWRDLRLLAEWVGGWSGEARDHWR